MLSQPVNTGRATGDRWAVLESAPMSKRAFMWSNALFAAAMACVLSCSRASDPSTRSAFDAPRAPAADGGEHATYFVRDGVLHDRCGEPVVLRGVNHPTLYVDRAGAAFAEIAKTGANSVRIFWAAGHGIPITASEPALQNAVRHHMLPILELHDSTCTWALDPIVSYWTSPEALALLTKYQSQLIINIANEASAPDASTFRDGYASIIRTLRRAGIHVPLMIDGAACGRDYHTLLEQGPALLAADPDHNLVFSAHLYDPLTQAQLAAIFDAFVRARLAFVVGEFANKQPPGCGAPLDYRSLIAEAHRYDIGWLAWSWGDDDQATRWNSDCEEFDMTRTFAFASLEGWGLEVAVTDPSSILHTARRPTSLTLGHCR